MEAFGYKDKFKSKDIRKGYDHKYLDYIATGRAGHRVSANTRNSGNSVDRLYSREDGNRNLVQESAAQANSGFGPDICYTVDQSSLRFNDLSRNQYRFRMYWHTSCIIDFVEDFESGTYPSFHVCRDPAKDPKNFSSMHFQ